MNSSEEQFLKNHWRQRQAALAPDVLAKLAKARQRALSQVPTRAPFRVPGWSLPIAALAASVMLGLAVWLVKPPSEQVVRVNDAEYLEDAEVLALSEDPGLYTEDPEFLEWSTIQLQTHGI